MMGEGHAGTINNQEKKQRLLHSLTKQVLGFDRLYLKLGILAFLISRASIMEGLTPFGIAFLSATMAKKRTGIFLAVFTSLGLLSFHGIGGYPYILALWGVYFVTLKLLRKKQATIFKVPLLTSVTLMGVRLSVVLMGEYLLYDLLMVAFEGIVGFALTYIFFYGLNTLENYFSRLFTNEEIISGSIMIALAVSGLGEILAFQLSIRNICGVVLVMLLAYHKGATMGTTVGVTIGLVTSMADPNMPLIIATFGFAGLLSGLFRELGRLGSGLGFLIGSGIMSLYMNGVSESIIGLAEGITGAVIFILLSAFMKKLGYKIVVGTSKGAALEDVYSKRIKDMTYKRLSEFSAVFEELGDTFKKVAQKENRAEQKDVSKFVDVVVADVCKSCSMYRFCWEGDFYVTYHAMFDVMSTIEMQGHVDEKNLPDYLQKRCVKPLVVAEKASYLFDLYKLNYRWENKILESRQLVAQQLDGVSKIIKELAGEIYSDIHFKTDVERVIYSELRNKNIDVKEVTVTESEDEKFVIYLDIKRRHKDQAAIERMIHLVSEIVGFQVARDKFSCSDVDQPGRIRFKLVKANRFGAVTRVAKYGDAFNYVSGDSYTFGEKQNNYFTVLSDGMGVGQKANEESSVTISLLEKFLEAGYDKELALKTINSVFGFKIK